MARISLYSQNNLRSTSFNTAGVPSDALALPSFVASNAANLSQLRSSAGSVFGQRAASYAGLAGFGFSRFFNDIQARQRQQQAMEAGRDELIRKNAIQLVGIDIQNDLAPVLNDTEVTDPADASEALKSSFEESRRNGFAKYGLDPNNPQNILETTSILAGANSKLNTIANSNRIRKLKEGAIGTLNSGFNGIDYKSGPAETANGIAGVLATAQSLYQNIPPKEYEDTVKKGTIQTIKNQLAHTILTQGAPAARQEILAGYYDKFLSADQKIEMAAFINKSETGAKSLINAPTVANVYNNLTSMRLNGASEQSIVQTSEAIKGLLKTDPKSAYYLSRDLNEVMAASAYDASPNGVIHMPDEIPISVQRPGQPPAPQVTYSYKVPAPGTLDLPRTGKVGKGLVPPPPAYTPDSGSILFGPNVSPFEPIPRSVKNGAPPPPVSSVDQGAPNRGYITEERPIQAHPLNDGHIVGAAPAGETPYTHAVTVSKYGVPNASNESLPDYISSQEDNVASLKTIYSNVTEAYSKFKKTGEVRHLEDISKLMGGPGVYPQDKVVQLDSLKGEISKGSLELMNLYDEQTRLKSVGNFTGKNQKLYALSNRIKAKQADIEEKQKKLENEQIEANQTFKEKAEKAYLGYIEDINKSISTSENNLLRAKENLSSGKTKADSNLESMKSKAITDYTKNDGAAKYDYLNGLVNVFSKKVHDVINEPQSDTSQTASVFKLLQEYKGINAEVDRFTKAEVNLDLGNGRSVKVAPFGSSHGSRIEKLRTKMNMMSSIMANALVKTYADENGDQLQGAIDNLTKIAGGSKRELTPNLFTILAKDTLNTMKLVGMVSGNKGASLTPHDRIKHLAVLDEVTKRVKSFESRQGTKADALEMKKIAGDVLVDIISGKLRL